MIHGHAGQGSVNAQLAHATVATNVDIIGCTARDAAAASEQAEVARKGPGLLDKPEPRNLNGADLGAVAQMGERCNRTAEVRSSILLGSTN